MNKLIDLYFSDLGPKYAWKESMAYMGRNLFY